MGPGPPFNNINNPQGGEGPLCAEVSLSFLRRREDPLRRGFPLFLREARGSS